MPALDPSLYPLIATCLLAGAIAGVLFCLALIWPRLRRLDTLEQRHVDLSSQLAGSQATLEERERRYREQVRFLRDSREQLTREFENLANRIFEDKGRRFNASSRESLEALLQPFREQISSFQTRVNEVHSEALRGNTLLESEIRKVLDVGLQMNVQAGNLTEALRGDNKVMGNWGEAQLERTLELSGLLPGDHYESQKAFTDHQGRRRLPDFLVRLPGDKHLVIDSKVSLLDYSRAVSATDDTEREEALTSHAKSVKRHIDELTDKDYGNLPGLGSPSFVLMFMPVEPAYIEALKADRELFDYGYRHNVVLVSHTTLMPVLRTVANLWMVDRSHREVQEIADAVGDIYNQVSTLSERLSGLGKSLAATSNHYNNTVTALVGKQGLHGKVDRFKSLSARASKTLPDIEPLNLDNESDRIDLAMEARRIVDEEDDSAAD